MIGTVTNTDGRYAFDNIPADASLRFTFMGMSTQSVAVGGRQVIDVVLQLDAETFDELIVVAYGTARRSSFTGSAATIKSDAIERRQVSNVSQALSGQVAGVQVMNSTGQPGVTSTVRIRGIGSMAAGNAPLYVVDGVPYDGDISSINSADMESVTVLKDAASNALYGARGANGVILVTTKRGTTREAVVKVDARWGTNRRAVPKYNVITDPAEYMTKMYEAVYNGYRTSAPGDTPEVTTQKANTALPTNANGGVGYNIYTVPAGESLFGLDGKMSPNATLGFVTGDFYYQPDDWYKELFDAGNLRQEYNASVSGATDKINYFFSAGYLDDTGIISNSGFSRYTTRANVDYQAKDWLKIGANLAYTNYDSQYPATQDGSSSSANLFYLVNFIAPIYPLYVRDNNREIMKDSRGFTIYDFGDATTPGPYRRTWMSGSNPASMLQLDKRNFVADVFGGRWFADVKLMEGLTFTYRLGVDLDNTRYKRLYNAYYGQYSNVGGIVYAGAYRTSGVIQQQLLNYNRAFDMHNIEILLGHEGYKYKSQSLDGSREKLFNPEIIEIDNAIVKPSAYSSTNNYGVEGYFARVQYEYDGKYIVSGSFRRDGSSRFYKENRWGNFGSVGAAWVLSKENFLVGLPWIDFLKYKISYGMQGNDDLLYTGGGRNFYPYIDQYELMESNNDFARVLNYKGNQDITWETSHSFNTGFDFNLFDDRLGGTIEYFNRTTSDMLYYMPVPISLGYAVFPKNIGSVVNSGVEIDLSGMAVRTNDFKLSLYANATFLKNKIKTLAPELDGELIDGTRIYREGESMYQLYIRNYAGVNEDGRALYYRDVEDANGNIIDKEKIVEWNLATYYATGDILPKVYGGLGTTMEFYGFDVSIFCAYQLGGRIFDSGYQTLMHYGGANSAGQNWHKDILKSWTPDNTNTDVPQINTQAVAQYAAQTSDRFLISSNYLDITNITVGYTLPKNLSERINVNSVRVYAAIDNAALFTKRTGLDPRQSYTSGGGARYAPIRSFSGGVSFSF